MGMALKDSPPGFDPAAAVANFDDSDEAFPEDEQL
jgi:DNA-directed RNA polymerase subunit alpha